MVPVAEKADLSQVYNNIAVIYVGSSCVYVCGWPHHATGAHEEGQEGD